MRNTLLILAFVLSGCSLDWPDAASGTYACAVDSDCADSFVCDTTQLQCVDKNTCPVGQHRVNDQCLPNNGLGSCWDGETSHDCSASTPANAEPSCELTDANASLYECSFECYATHTLVDFECVELGCPEGEHLVGEDCVRNDSINNCWNGEASINCTEIFPPPYTPSVSRTSPRDFLFATTSALKASTVWETSVIKTMIAPIAGTVKSRLTATPSRRRDQRGPVLMTSPRDFLRVVLIVIPTA